MASKYWIKLYHEILDDPKMGQLSDRLWRRAIELFLLAGERDPRDGNLPSPADMAWRLRISEEELIEDLQALSWNGVEIVTKYNDWWYVTKFVDRQGPIPSEERSRQFRDRERKENYYQTEDERQTNEQRTQIERCVRDLGIPTIAQENTEAERKPNESFVESDTESETESETDKKQTTDKEAEKEKTAVVAVLLSDFGVEEPWLSDLAAICSERDVKNWIACINGNDGIKNPTGFLISRLRIGESPPAEKQQRAAARRWFTGDDFKQYFVQPGETPKTKGD